jgi:hypothetical protein
MLLSAIQARQDAEGRIDWDISVDSTTVRAHPQTTPTASRARTEKGNAARTNEGDPALATLAARLALFSACWGDWGISGVAS